MMLSNPPRHSDLAHLSVGRQHTVHVGDLGAVPDPGQVGTVGVDRGLPLLLVPPVLDQFVGGRGAAWPGHRQMAERHSDPGSAEDGRLRPHHRADAQQVAPNSDAVLAPPRDLRLYRKGGGDPGDLPLERELRVVHSG